MDFLSALVTLFGILMSLAHFPQAYRIIKRKSADDISLITYIIFSIGAVVWLAYGLSISDMPIIASFIVGTAGAALVLVFKIYYSVYRKSKK